MVKWLFVLFTVVPVVELYILIKIGNVLGALNTVLLLIGMALLGALLVRLEGIRTFSRMTSNLSQGIVPAEELVDGLLIFAAGVLLITPGVFTDILAIFLLIPFSRALIKRWLRRKFDRMVASGRARLYFDGGR
ncbi:MAG: FxsA family protein [Deltaproteobacteria bacterium]|nr:FxsA family protein [Deltaproteobacteria bacterium]